MTGAMEIFEVTKAFPKEERDSMVDQMRRSSRSVCANIGEAWRRRRISGPNWETRKGKPKRRASGLSLRTDADTSTPQQQATLMIDTITYWPSSFA